MPPRGAYEHDEQRFREKNLSVGHRDPPPVTQGLYSSLPPAGRTPRPSDPCPRSTSGRCRQGHLCRSRVKHLGPHVQIPRVPVDVKGVDGVAVKTTPEPISSPWLRRRSPDPSSCTLHGLHRWPLNRTLSPTYHPHPPSVLPEDMGPDGDTRRPSGGSGTRPGVW